MFLHLGADVIIPLREVVAIFDLKAVRGGLSNEFIKRKKEKKLVIEVVNAEPKSCIVTDQTIYLSAISSQTLKKRAVNIFAVEEEDN